MAGRPRKAEPEVALNAAMKAFWAKGFEATSMVDLTDATGLHKASLYQTFGDKRSLFISALSHYLKISSAALKESVEGEANPVVALGKCVTQLVEHCAEGKGCLAVNTLIEVAPYDPEVKKILKQFWQGLEKQVIRLIEAAQAEKQVSRHLGTRDAARLITIFMHGLSANMAAGLSVNKARAMVLDHVERVLFLRKK